MFKIWFEYYIFLFLSTAHIHIVTQSLHSMYMQLASNDTIVDLPRLGVSDAVIVVVVLDNTVVFTTSSKKKNAGIKNDQGKKFLRKTPFQVRATSALDGCAIKKYGSTSQLGMSLYIRCWSSSQKNKAEEYKNLTDYIPLLSYC